MKINVVYEPSTFRALWKWDLLTFKRWKWLDVTPHDMSNIYSLLEWADPDFKYPHLDDPRINSDIRHERQPETTEIPF